MKSSDGPLSSLSDKRLTMPPPLDRMRILICIEALGVGGKERQAVELIKGLACQADLVCRLVREENHDFYLDQLAGRAISVDFAARRMRWDVGSFYRLYQT